jgi:hypothetical protein
MFLRFAAFGSPLHASHLQERRADNHNALVVLASALNARAFMQHDAQAAPRSAPDRPAAPSRTSHGGRPLPPRTKRTAPPPQPRESKDPRRTPKAAAESASAPRLAAQVAQALRPLRPSPPPLTPPLRSLQVAQALFERSKKNFQRALELDPGPARPY